MELPVLQLLGHLAPGDATAAIWEAGLRALVVLSTVFLPALLTWKVLRPASFGPRPLILTALFVIVCNVIFWRGAAYLPGEADTPASIIYLAVQPSCIATRVLHDATFSSKRRACRTPRSIVMIIHRLHLPGSALTGILMLGPCYGTGSGHRAPCAS